MLDPAPLISMLSQMQWGRQDLAPRIGAFFKFQIVKEKASGQKPHAATITTE